jgi:hypothetical protein
MLIAPDAPAPIAIQRIATAANTGCIEPGATNKPAAPENTTSDITRGLSKARKSRTLGSALGFSVSVDTTVASAIGICLRFFAF